MNLDLDQFYTKPETAKMCWDHLQGILPDLQYYSQFPFFVEPGVGRGDFYKLFPERHRMGIDIDPKIKGVIKDDFFKIVSLGCLDSIIVGNPPFGQRGKKALNFLMKALYLAKTVAFILPVSFRKYHMQKKILHEVKLVSELILPRKSFYVEDHTPYEINTVFQVWTSLNTTLPDMRITERPPYSHEDFEIYQYNNTIASQKIWDNVFDFAVPCQGWQNYDRRETELENCEMTKQWILLKAHSLEARNRLLMINFPDLSNKCGTIVPGFRKSDLVQEYTKIKKLEQLS